VAIPVTEGAPAPSPTAISDPATPIFPNLQNDPLYDQETYQSLRDVLVDVSWKQAELGQVLRNLTLTVRTARPIAADLNFYVSSSAPPNFRHRRISLMIKREPVFDVLGYLAQQAGFTIKVHSGVVVIVPR
jgi:hypothetical protein